MKCVKFLLCLALICSLLVSCAGSPPEYRGADKNGQYIKGSGAELKYLSAETFSSDRTADTVTKEFRTAAADLGLRLLKSCEKNRQDSVMISPLSVLTAFAMVTNGADGNTLAQLQDFMGGLEIADLNTQLFNYYSSLTSSDNASFRAANSVWLTSSPSFSVNGDFLKIMDNTYDAQIISADFTKSEKIAQAVNGWCAEKTDDMIKEVVAPDMFDEYTIMLLINALCFEGDWEKQYEEYDCRDAVFRGTSGDSKIKLMYSSEICSNYIEGKNETGFIKYYSGRKYAFAALLPDEKLGISDYIKKLDAETFAKLIADTREGFLTAALPEFSLDYDVALPDIMKAMGVTDAFSGELADFSGLGRSSDGNLYIANAIHKTHIDVDPSGTRAAAVTVIDVATESCEQPYTNSYAVILDRPFVYAIIDTEYNIPLFLGVCENIG